MQIPTEYGEDYIVLAVSVGLATIGVCVFCAVASVAALFILSKKERKTENENLSSIFTGSTNQIANKRRRNCKKNEKV